MEAISHANTLLLSSDYTVVIFTVSERDVDKYIKDYTVVNMSDPINLLVAGEPQVPCDARYVPGRKAGSSVLLDSQVRNSINLLKK